MPDTRDDDRLLKHWGAMVRVTHGMVDSHEDAEDCASAALLQFLERGIAGVDHDQAFLVSVAKRRAIDRMRSQARRRIRDDRLANAQPPVVMDIAEDIASRAEAAWLDETAREVLSPRAYRLVRLLADGHEIGEAARIMGMTQRAAESLLLRARRRVRRAWAATLALLGGCLAAIRRWGPQAAPTATLAASALLALGAPALGTGVQPPSGRVHGAGANSGRASAHPAVTPGAVRYRAEATVSREHPGPGRGAAVDPPPRPRRELVVVREPMGGSTIVTREGDHESTVDTVVHCAENVTVTQERIGC